MQKAGQEKKVSRGRSGLTFKKEVSRAGDPGSWRPAMPDPKNRRISRHFPMSGSGSGSTFL